MSNTLLESLWARIDANIGARITQISNLLTQALSANTESIAARDGAVSAAGNAASSASNASASEGNAAVSESNAAASESAAGRSESNASSHAETAGTFAQNAQTSASSASQSRQYAATSAQQANDSALVASDARGDAVAAAELAEEQAGVATTAASQAATAIETYGDGRYLRDDPTYGLVPRLVHHGTDPKTPRPATDGSVIWLGVPRPVHSQPGDVLMRPAGSEADWAPDWLNLVGWYDPSALTPGSTVTHVEDLSGRENHLSIPGGTGTITAQEGEMAHPALSFDGNSWISSELLKQGQWTHPTTVWVVVAFDEVIGNAMSIFDSASAPIPNKSTVFISNYGRFSAGAGVNLFGTEVVPLGTPTLLMVNFAGGSTSHGELNGVQSFGPTDLGAGTPDSHRLGANGARANPFKGSIGEVIVASGATSSDREAVTTYLMDKWGIV